jgi:hypothetical protein
MAFERFRVTFETLSPGEFAEDEFDSVTGFAGTHGWKFEVTDPGPHEMTLREARDIASGCLEDSGRWFTTIDTEDDYRSGERTIYSIHPPENITRASYRRLARVLGCRP